MSEPHLICRDRGYEDCPTCYGRGECQVGTGNASGEGGEEWRVVDCWTCEWRRKAERLGYELGQAELDYERLSAENERLRPATAAEAPVGRSRSALLRRVAELEEMVRVDNAVCLCGCGEHENLGEDGESCGDDAHFCLRVAPSVLSYVNGLRAALIAPAAEGKGTVKESLSVGETARTHASAPAAEAGRTGWTGCDCKEPCGLKQDELSEWDYCPNCDHAPKCHAAPKQRGSE